MRQAGMCALAICLVATVLPARADLVRLRSGGEIRGSIEGAGGLSDRQQFKITTMTGAVVVVARETVEFATRRAMVLEEFETRLKLTPPEIEPLWELSVWCLKNHLRTSRKIPLERILEIDPRHERAHRALGHVQRNGQWMTRDEAMRAQGLVKYKGKYITPQELELLEKSDAQREAEIAWYKKVRVWRAWLLHDRQKEGLENLRKIKDPNAIEALTKFLGEHEEKSVRMLYIEILASMGGPSIVGPLATMALRDEDYEVRYEALNGIPKERTDDALPLFVRGLKSEHNSVVGRAAKALERFGDQAIVPQLIDALVTTHKYKVRVPSGTTYSFGTDGSVGRQAVIPPEVEAMLRAGQLPYGVEIHQPLQGKKPMRTVYVKRELRNKEVLAALERLTGQNFGYDARTWRLWLAAKNNGAFDG